MGVMLLLLVVGGVGIVISSDILMGFSTGLLCWNGYVEENDPPSWFDPISNGDELAIRCWF